MTGSGHSRRSDGRQGFAECPLCLQWRPNLCVATNRRDVPGRDIAPPITAVMPAAEAVLRGLSRKIALRPVHPFAASACSAVHRSKLGIKARDLISQIDWLAPSVVAAAAHVG